MKRAFLAVAIGSFLGAGAMSTHATVISTTGDGEIIAAPSQVLNGQVFNTHQQGFNEKQGVTLGSALAVDAGTVAAGSVVDSQMIFLNQRNVQGQDAELVDTGIVWTFSGAILGVMSDNNGAEEAASSALLGATGTAYPNGFNNRGFENNDNYVILGNQLTVNMHVTQPGDWIRVITRANVPDVGSSAGLLGLALSSLFLVRRKLSV